MVASQQPQAQADGQSLGEGLAPRWRFQARWNHDFVARGGKTAFELELNFGPLPAIEEQAMLPLDLFLHTQELIQARIHLGGLAADDAKRTQAGFDGALFRARGPEAVP